MEPTPEIVGPKITGLVLLFMSVLPIDEVSANSRNETRTTKTQRGGLAQHVMAQHVTSDEYESVLTTTTNCYDPPYSRN